MSQALSGASVGGDGLRKADERAAKKLAKQAQADAARAAKRFESFSSRKTSGSLQEYEIVLLMDAATAASPLGRALAADLDSRRTIGWQVCEKLPLSGRWRGCSCFCFKRRQLCEADEGAFKTASSMRVHSFPEDNTSSPPHLLLVFEQPDTFLQQLQQDELAGLLAAVASSHAGCSLGMAVLGLKSCVQKLENACLRQGGVASTNWRRVQSQVLALQLGRPGLQLRLAVHLEEAVLHVIHTARVVAQQPYAESCELEACGTGGPGQASIAGAAQIRSDLGPLCSHFAINTLGKLHGMGATKAWAIAKAYPSLGALITGFEQAKASSGPDRAPLLLADLLEPAGSKARPRRVGPALSQRMYCLLTCEDPDAIVEGEADLEQSG